MQFLLFLSETGFNVRNMQNHPVKFPETLDETFVWDLLLSLKADPTRPLPDGLQWTDSGLAADCPATTDAHDLLALYGTLVHPDLEGCYVIGHLGQSLDGRIATENGVSQYISGQENLIHLHRLRALSDVVLVGASTVAHDDPKLTTRLVSGDHPTRVVLDPHRRLRVEHGIFSDGIVETILISTAESIRETPSPKAATMLEIETGSDGFIAAQDVVDALAERGLNRLFIEGGGRTVSHFLEQGVLTRLHVAVSPVIIGSGRAGLTLPAIDTLEHAIRPDDVVTHVMGRDVVFDCRLDKPEDQL